MDGMIIALVIYVIGLVVGIFLMGKYADSVDEFEIYFLMFWPISIPLFLITGLFLGIYELGKKSRK